MIEILIIIGLLIYIGFLYYKLSKNRVRNDQIKAEEENTDKNTYKEDDYRISPFNQSDSDTHKARNNIFSKEIISFIFDQDNTKSFLHYTAYQSDADKIISEGFKFVTSFYKTAEEVRNDMTDLAYKHNLLSAYGRFVVVICIDKTLYEHFLDETLKITAYDVFVEQILTEKPPFLNEDSDMIYTLHHKFIKGYFDYKTGKIVENPHFNPTFCSGIFEKNLQKLSI
jgi:hypothetical protein